MKDGKKYNRKQDTFEKADKDSIKKLKNKMKHQTDALNKILKNIKK